MSRIHTLPVSGRIWRPSSRTSSRYGLIPLLTHAVILLCLLTLAKARDEGDHQARAFQTLSQEDILGLVNLSPAQWEGVDEGHLGKLLIPRASGSQNNTLVQNYISSVFRKLDWQEEKVSFTGETPIGPIEFTNLIYTFPSKTASRHLVLSAHFDSKWFPDFPANQFIGATDSAAPCAMLLDLAEALTPLLKNRENRLENGQAILTEEFDEEIAAEVGLQLIFFDGEEAFHDWTATDSIYGSRHLAELWQSTYLPRHHPLAKRRMSPPPTILSTIDHLVLLDLLGNSHTRIFSFFRETDWLHDKMASADQRLRENGLVEFEKGEEGWFPTFRLYYGQIGDDHVPFLEKGVSILHVISNPFPTVWHTLADDGSALHLPSLRRWNRILRVFTTEYLGLTLDHDMKSTKSSKSVQRATDDLVGG